MLTFDIFMNLANIMLILNGFNVAPNKVDAITSSSINTGKQHELTIMQNESKKNDGMPVGGIDFLNIRHERSKHRRYTISEKEQQLQPHLTIKLYEARPNNEGLYLQHAINDQKAAAVKSIDDNISNDELQMLLLTKQRRYSENIHSAKSNDINTALVSATNINVVSNVTTNLNKANADKVRSNSNDMLAVTDTSNIQNILQATSEIHYLATSALAPTTTLTAVTHKIRKLHKKKIVESLRQLNIDKFNTNGGHLAKNHHRSLLEAEHLQQQQAQLKDTSKIPQTSGGSNQQQITTETNIDTNNSHIVDKEPNRNEATNNVDTSESVNDGNLTNIMDRDDTVTDDDDDDDDDDGSEQDSVDSLSDVFYQNDESNLNGSIDEAVNVNGDDDVDVLYATTIDSLMYENFEKQLKNFSSEFIKDIDNNVDLDDTERENMTLLTAWQQIRNSKLKPLNLTNNSKAYSHVKTEKLLHNLTEDSFFNNTSFSPKFSFDGEFSSEEHYLQPLLSASTSDSKNSFFEKEEINFNDSSDQTRDDDSASKDLIMDEAINDNDVSDQANGFSLSDLEEVDTDTATETEGTSEATSEDNTNHFLEGVVDAANSEETYDWDEISRSNRRDLMHGRDVVTKFLQIVETQHSLGSNCEAGTSLNLGEGVVDRYAQDRFRVEAEVAVNRANMLTR